MYIVIHKPIYDFLRISILSIVNYNNTLTNILENVIEEQVLT